MNFVKMHNPIPGASSRVATTTGAPSAGTTEVQTLTITATAGAFKLSMDGIISASIVWNVLAAALQTILRAMANIGATGVTVTGTGPWTLTFGGPLDKKLLSTLSVVQSTLTGGTASIAKTTPGVNATHRGAAKGQVLVDDGSGVLYVNTGTPTAPVWTAQA